MASISKSSMAVVKASIKSSGDEIRSVRATDQEQDDKGHWQQGNPELIHDRLIY